MGFYTQTKFLVFDYAEEKKVAFESNIWWYNT